MSTMPTTEEKRTGDDGEGSRTGGIQTPKAPVRRSTSTTTDRQAVSYDESVTFSVFITWVLPVLFIAILTRFAVDKEAEFVGMGVGGKGGGGAASSKPITIDLSKEDVPTTAPSGSPVPYDQPPKPKKPNREPTPVPTYLSNKPSGYIDVVQAIGRRRLDWSTTDSAPVSGSSSRGSSSTSQSASPPAASPTKTKTDKASHGSTSSSSSSKLRDPPRGASSDPVRSEMMQRINRLRDEYETDKTDLYTLLSLADLLRLHDVQYHDGGSLQEETIQRYQTALNLALERKQRLIENGEETNRNRKGTVDVNEEIMLDYTDRSIDGILCAIYTALGKTYFMANMFEKSVDSYTEALRIESHYLDALSSRGSSRIILGQYEKAAEDFTETMENDHAGRFLDVFTGLARVLQARESAVPQGWDPMIDTLHAMIPTLEIQYENLSNAAREGNSNAVTAQKMLSGTLNRLYHVLFLYHDVKTNNTNSAWNALTKSYNYKMSALPAWSAGFESQKIVATKQIFHRGFWPEDVGSSTAVPIFIIGFVRSGSTLLERVLDAHPQIVGTGENSVFNGRLDYIRNTIVEASQSADTEALKNVISTLADGVVDEMKERWKMIASGEDRAADQPDAERYVDKMLTNYYNVGFIHMLFPNSLILHVAREPMDTIFSAYKHEFPTGTLDYTSQFDSLAELYHAYRDLIEHWDRVLPGRITHVRYEDMVHDMPNVARKVIEATGLDWDDSVLDFHKKKQAVNTLSTTQVRKGIYKDSLQAWRRYETHLDPLVQLIGARTKYDLKTSLEGYEKPIREDDDPLDDLIEISNESSDDDDQQEIEVNSGDEEQHGHVVDDKNVHEIPNENELEDEGSSEDIVDEEEEIVHEIPNDHEPEDEGSSEDIVEAEEEIVEQRRDDYQRQDEERINDDLEAEPDEQVIEEHHIPETGSHPETSHQQERQDDEIETETNHPNQDEL